MAIEPLTENAVPGMVLIFLVFVMVYVIMTGNVATQPPNGTDDSTPQQQSTP